jgi:pimeloyl-ACP methyl ester carboxylesterase
MPTGSGAEAVLERARGILRRGWYWGADYRWATRAIGRGFVRRDVPHGYAHGWLGPVLLIPGVLEEWTLMRPVAERLNRAGHPVHVLPELKRNTITVVEGAALASAYLDAHDLREVVIVAHSKGGLIGKRVLLDDADRRVRHLVAIATPFSGSGLARLVPSRPVRAMSPEDATIVELGSRPEVNRQITSISPSFDPHIPTGSHLEGATNVRVAAMGHFRILADPEVLDAVVAAAS